MRLQVEVRTTAKADLLVELPLYRRRSRDYADGRYTEQEFYAVLPAAPPSTDRCDLILVENGQDGLSIHVARDLFPFDVSSSEHFWLATGEWARLDQGEMRGELTKVELHARTAREFLEKHRV